MCPITGTQHISGGAHSVSQQGRTHGLDRSRRPPHGCDGLSANCFRWSGRSGAPGTPWLSQDNGHAFSSSLTNPGCAGIAPAPGVKAPADMSLFGDMSPDRAGSKMLVAGAELPASRFVPAFSLTAEWPFQVPSATPRLPANRVLKHSRSAGSPEAGHTRRQPMPPGSKARTFRTAPPLQLRRQTGSGFSPGGGLVLPGAAIPAVPGGLPVRRFGPAGPRSVLPGPSRSSAGR